MPIKHLVASKHHALLAHDDARRLRVFGWGCNWQRELGFPASREPWLAHPTEIEFAYPEQPAEAFPSMLAACEGCSLVMVGGRVWGMGGHNSHLYYEQAREHPWCCDEHIDVQPIDPRWFEHKEIAYVGVGPSHAAFLSTCGQVYVRGHYDRSIISMRVATTAAMPVMHSQTTACRRPRGASVASGCC